MGRKVKVIENEKELEENADSEEKEVEEEIEELEQPVEETGSEFNHLQNMLLDHEKRIVNLESDLFRLTRNKFY